MRMSKRTFWKNQGEAISDNFTEEMSIVYVTQYSSGTLLYVRTKLSNLHGSHISFFQQLQLEMKNATEMAHRIRSDMEKTKNKYHILCF